MTPGTILMPLSSAGKLASLPLVNCRTLVCIFIFDIMLIVGAIGDRGGTETSGTGIARVNCFGNESKLTDCERGVTTSCSSQEIATVICQGRT